MYYILGLVMASSYLRASAISVSMLPRRACPRIVQGRQIGSAFHFVLPLALLTGAMLLAPEQPEQQASICQRHHPVVACQVW